MLQNELFNKVIQENRYGYWLIHEDSDKMEWSNSFLDLLGYNKAEFSSDLNTFLQKLIHPEEVATFRDNFLNYKQHQEDFKQYVTILNKEGNYQSFRCLTNEELPVDIKSEKPFLFFFEIQGEQPTLRKDNFYYRETAQMTATGSWYVDFKKKESYWDFETYRILDYPEDYRPSLKDSAAYYAKEHQQLAADCFFNCAMMGTPFNTEIKMVTAKNKKFWAKAIGKPVYNDDKEIIGIRGVFQDVDERKKREINLQKSHDIIVAQNSRLFNFAHIVSHNLRSHTSNLSLITQLIEDIDDPAEKSELLGQIKGISNNLNTTIDHLNELVTIYTNEKQEKVFVSFKQSLNLVMNGIGQIINSSNAQIQTDFTECEGVQFIPAYMESIFLNLLTNAIKYKHENRDPVILIRSYIRNQQKFLEIKDNGKGIDMTLFKDQVFGMYKTFHYNEDAVGIGLFLTKNQVISLGGDIQVESKLEEGTTFTIQFK
ncbi:PAS domain-containing sensor histidine kinase [Aquimarina sp. ERC-38]|uniref:PAS domain-containing sensor histidine kinase n=1 Tax=Aquimarina sp. ERC-38 TaxID=2949996 RepID=UPI002247D1BA|nr:PAS domain-containing sensor histidine kinase [Aquimarina sp. ERC-38]UZO81791.1 PAS domain-containing sensor histidine kinase [Aquimarina sp. ERC-38]